MSPGLVWNRLAGCFLAGILLGPAVDLFRPVHRRLPVLTQLLMAAEFFACWLWLGFGLCRGDLRLGYFSSAALGFYLWERCFGTCTAAFFAIFWHAAAIPPKFCLKIFQKISNFLFARWKKWSTIKYSNRQIPWRRSGGPRHDKDPQLSQPLSAPIPPHIHPEQGCDRGGCCVVFPNTAVAASGEAEETLADLRQQAAILDQRNDELRRDIDELGTTDSVRKIAQEELGLVDPDTIIFENAD